MTTQILIIEDDKELGEIMVEILADFSTSVLHITNGQFALKYLTESSPDLIFLDLHLPEVSGIHILQFIREQAHLNQTRIIVMTADALKADELRSIADDVLVKPVTLDQVIEFAEKYLP